MSAAEPPVHEQRPSTSVAPAPRASSTGAESTQDRIANLQRALHRLCYDPGPPDGIPGARTRAAIRAFQADAGLPITGQISEGLESAVLAAIVAAGQSPASTPEPTRPPLERESTGSGFRVSGQGHFLINAHVVRGCTEVHLPPAGVVEVMARDEPSDLALLQTLAGTARAVAKFRQGRGIRPGASVVVVGYPLRGLLASEANVSTGAVSALAGPGDDRRLIQITLQATLMANPAAGDLIRGSGGIRKIRWAAAGTGKRGGLRVICYWITKRDHLLLLTMYRKSEVSDLTPVEVRALRAFWWKAWRVDT